MQLKWFRIPVGGCPEMEEELNAFLRGHRVLSVTRELVERDSAPGWAVCVEYQEGTVAGEARRGGSGRAAKKIDYREVLSEADFAVFSKLRELRKSLAESEGVPVYAIFTNEQLATEDSHPGCFGTWASSHKHPNLPCRDKAFQLCDWKQNEPRSE